MIASKQQRRKAYNRLANMQQRCYNPKSFYYYNYGGRGIKICDRWRGAGRIDRFLEDVGVPPDDSFTLDRIDNDGDYTPENCRWASKKTQAINRRYTLSNKTGHKGVFKNGSAWTAYISVKSKQISLGTFKTIEEAVAVRQQAEKEHYVIE